MLIFDSLFRLAAVDDPSPNAVAEAVAETTDKGLAEKTDKGVAETTDKGLAEQEKAAAEQQEKISRYFRAATRVRHAPAHIDRNAYTYAMCACSPIVGCFCARACFQAAAVWLSCALTRWQTVYGCNYQCVANYDAMEALLIFLYLLTLFPFLYIIGLFLGGPRSGSSTGGTDL